MCKHLGSLVRWKWSSAVMIGKSAANDHKVANKIRLIYPYCLSVCPSVWLSKYLYICLSISHLSPSIPISSYLKIHSSYFKAHFSQSSLSPSVSIFTSPIGLNLFYALFIVWPHFLRCVWLGKKRREEKNEVNDVKWWGQIEKKRGEQGMKESRRERKDREGSRREGNGNEERRSGDGTTRDCANGSRMWREKR